MKHQEYRERLDEILAKHGAEPGEMTHSLKQAILRWVADEVIGEDETVIITNPDSVDYGQPYSNVYVDRDEQRKILAQHGYKGGDQMTNYNERLDEILERYRLFANMAYSEVEDGLRTADEFKDVALPKVLAEAKQAILDWHNKQVEEAMAKFHLKKGVKYDVKASNSVIVITHTNKLKERDDDQL